MYTNNTVSIGQAFLPALFAQDKRQNIAQQKARALATSNSSDTLQTQQQYDDMKPRAASAMIKKLLLIGVVIGGVNALAAGLVPMRFPHWFTYDPQIVHEMKG
jgi:chemotaxis response regulator CheB